MIDSSLNFRLELFLTRDQIHQRVQEMAAEISRDFAGQSLVLIGVLKGASIFLADLARAIPLDCALEFISLSSYGDARHSSGAVRLIRDIEEPIENRNVLIVEDVLDTGVTLSYLRDRLLARRPSSLKIATLLDKPCRRIQKIDADYIGVTIHDRFVVGYGMDCAQHFRNLPDIYFLPPDITFEE